MKRILKRIGIGLLIIIAVLALSGFLFVNTSDQFGGEATEERLARYERSPNYQNGVFVNETEFNLEMDCHSVQKMIKEMWTPDPDVAPKQNIEVMKMDSLDIVKHPDSLTRVTWFGHSTVFLEVEGKRILFDPMFGQYAAPHSWLGSKRYNSEMPIDVALLPAIDAVVISHDHYDHLDYETIVALRSKTSHFYVPLGIGNHLAKWEVDQERIHEMDWWEEADLEGLTIACAPSRHMSGRGFNDQFSTLWASWVVQSDRENIYFSGDGGYGPRFKKINEVYGPFDLAMLECGQYNTLWADVHMMPEETAQAGIDLEADLVLPIHWGSFTLATHSWTDPVDRLSRKAAEVELDLTTPRIGESFTLHTDSYPGEMWWKESAR